MGRIMCFSRTGNSHRLDFCSSCLTKTISFSKLRLLLYRLPLENKHANNAVFSPTVWGEETCGSLPLPAGCQEPATTKRQNTDKINEIR